jgi:hypothetical protein
VLASCSPPVLEPDMVGATTGKLRCYNRPHAMLEPAVLFATTGESNRRRQFCLLEPAPGFARTSDRDAASMMVSSRQVLELATFFAAIGEKDCWNRPKCSMLGWGTAASCDRRPEKKSCNRPL